MTSLPETNMVFCIHLLLYKSMASGGTRPAGSAFQQITIIEGNKIKQS
jgi:hypothetical protein